jgi:hypothetical protein
MGPVVCDLIIYGNGAVPSNALTAVVLMKLLVRLAPSNDPK